VALRDGQTRDMISGGASPSSRQSRLRKGSMRCCSSQISSQSSSQRATLRCSRRSRITRVQLGLSFSERPLKNSKIASTSPLTSIYPVLRAMLDTRAHFRGVRTTHRVPRENRCDACVAKSSDTTNGHAQLAHRPPARHKRPLKVTSLRCRGSPETRSGDDHVVYLFFQTHKWRPFFQTHKWRPCEMRAGRHPRGHVRLKIKDESRWNFKSLHEYTFKYHLLCALSGFFSSTTSGFYRRCWPYGQSFPVSYS